MDKHCKNEETQSRPKQYYLSQFGKISEKDLKYVEKDLVFYEKVSLTFLLYGNDKIQSVYALQNLIILSRCPKESSELLYNFAKLNNTNWKPLLIEALTVIRANKVLRKLGFDVNELYYVFLPHIAETSLHIHPILKALYVVCERLTEAEAGKIILEMRNTHEAASTLRFYDQRYLEIFLLDWITKSIINIGNFPLKSTPSSSNSNPEELQSNVNLEALYQCLKLFEFNYLKGILCCATQQMNKKIEIRTRNEKTIVYRNENDSALTDADNNFEKKESYVISYDECYLVRKECAGFVLIINQEEFYKDKNPEIQDLLPEKSLSDRRGTEMDKKRLEEIFSTFGYRSIVRNNQTNVQMLNEIRDTVRRSEIFDSVIICILSHGTEGIVYGCNSIPVEIQKIQNTLASDLLLSKPKLLFIQACQGENLQKAKLIRKFEYDSPETRVPAYSDMLTAISTVPGFASIRHIEKGSWFIQTLCKQVNDHGDKKHMLDILTSVIKEVSIKRGNEDQCMVPQTYSTLSKSLFLPRRF